MPSFSNLANRLKKFEDRVTAINTAIEYLEMELEDEIWEKNESCQVQLTVYKDEYEMQGKSSSEKMLEHMGVEKPPTYRQKKSSKTLKLIGTSPILFLSFLRQCYIDEKNKVLALKNDSIKSGQDEILGGLYDDNR